MTTVYIPALLRDYTSGAEEVEIPLTPGETVSVRRLLDLLDEKHPGFRDHLLMEGELIPGIAVFVNSEQALMGLQAKVENAGVVHFIPPVVGG